MSGETNPFEVLIAEDQEHVREALAMLLRSHGYVVRQCSSPVEALAAATQPSIDLALVDMNYRRDSTSGVEGLNLIESLRQLDATLPIVALTAWGNVDLAVNAMKFGASDFVEKPWRNDSLLEKVNALTSRGRAVRAQRRVSEYEQQDAKLVQMRIVPRRHILAGSIELYGESVPVGTVGGDYFGAWQPDPETLHVCIADVSGKGTPGALIAAMLHASVSTLAMSGGRPEEIVSEVEAISREQLSEGHYVTLFYGVLNVNTGVLEYANAGHCPPLLRRSDGAIESLAATRPVLGLLNAQNGRAERVVLHLGDRLVLFTDGITEATDAKGKELGDEGLTVLLGGHEDLPSWHARVLQTVREHRKLTDDATLVAISMRGPAVKSAATQTTREMAPSEK